MVFFLPRNSLETKLKERVVQEGRKSTDFHSNFGITDLSLEVKEVIEGLRD